MSTVFDFNEVYEIFHQSPEVAFKLLAENVRHGVMQAELRDVQAIGGGLKDDQDTVRLIIDLKTRLVSSG